MVEKTFKAHPIQLKALKVLELSIKILTQEHQDKLPEVENFRLYHGSSVYDPTDRNIAVKVGVEIGYTDEMPHNIPFQLKVELLGIFDVDDKAFPIDKITVWAKENAPIILYPYLREHVYSLTLRAGFSGMLLPLLQVPVFRSAPNI